MKTIAVCRSPYHLELLRQNVELNEVLALLCIELPCEDIHHIFIGEESKAVSFKSLKANRQYYRKIESIIVNEKAIRILLFNTYTPLSKFLINRFDGKDVEFQLWEDGLNHYLHEHNGIKFFIKSLAKSAIGFYPGQSLRVYGKYSGLVCDRFDRNNLHYSLADVYSENGEAYFIGQPIVEDGFVSAVEFEEGLKKVFEFANLPAINYVPHPREKFSIALISSNVGRLGKWNLVRPRDLGYSSAEHLLSSLKCSFCFSAFSTVIFNVNMPRDKNFALPSFFGLKKISRKLENLKSAGVTVVVNA